MSDVNSPKQFGQYSITKKSSDDADAYHALKWVNTPPREGAQLDRSGYHGVAEVNVVHSPGHSSTLYPASTDEGAWTGRTSDPDEASWEGYNRNWIDKTTRGWNYRKYAGQIPLFEHDSSMPTSTLDYMITTKADRAIGMTLLGMAARDTLTKHGRVLKPSNDLSTHSSSMVHKLADRGVTAVPQDEMRNNITWRSEPGSWEGRKLDEWSVGKPAPAHDVRAGQQFLRNVLRDSRNRPTVVDQPTLFDKE